MLVRFTVENYLSFRDRVELSMVASGKVRRHPNDVVRTGAASEIPLLKLALIYGANASGKSNLVRAMSHARDLILHPASPEEQIPLTPFKLDPECRKKPSRFEFEIKVNDRFFAYGFAATARRIEEEWLVALDGDDERGIFERTNDGIVLGDLHYADKTQEQFLKFTAKGTLENRLFLTECRERDLRKNVPGARVILDVLSWFERAFGVIFPDSQDDALVRRIYESGWFRKELSRYLSCFDTGIAKIDLRTANPAKFDIPLHLIRPVQSRPAEAQPIATAQMNGDFFVFDLDRHGKVRSQKLVATHGRKDSAGSKIAFDMKEESDGTRRLIDLVPAMIALTRRDSVFVIDELDRSLHPEILHSYLANFLKYSSGRESQLIVTTHDTTILEQPFIRRDEVWFVEKGEDHSSRVIALEEYKNSHGGRSLQQDYLRGRFGGVPVIRDFSWLRKAHAEGT
jgi:uncharacterized protein